LGSGSESILSTPEVLQELNKILAEDPPNDDDDTKDGEKSKPIKREPSATQLRMELDQFRLSFPRVNPPFAVHTQAKDKTNKTIFEAVSPVKNKSSHEDGQTTECHPKGRLVM